MSFARSLTASVLLLALLAGCAQGPDGSSPNAFQDVQTLTSGSAALSPAQQELRQRERDYASTRLQGAAVGAVVGTAACYLAGVRGAALAACLAGGGAVGYVGTTYLTRDNQDFQATQEGLQADIAEAQADSQKAAGNVGAARNALRYQRSEIDRLNQGYRSGSVSAADYEAKLKAMADDVASVRTMREQTETRVSALRQSAGTYRQAGLPTGELSREASAQERHAENLRQVEEDMVRLIGGAPDGVATPSV